MKNFVLFQDFGYLASFAIHVTFIISLSILQKGKWNFHRDYTESVHQLEECEC